jgi:two-component system, NarL family, sensor histidine kinase UhpB
MRFTGLPLFWRVFAINTAPLVVATLLLMFAPVTLHAPIRLTEAVILSAGLAVILAANLLLLRPAFASLNRLVQRMHTVDLLRPGQRLPEGGGVEVAELVRGFNEMLTRLEKERRESGRRALAAQEAERLRIARGLHDEVGQILTGVLLQLGSLADAGAAQRESDLEEAKHATRQALEEVRRIAHELRPATLEHLGLLSALTELTTKFADLSGIVIDRRFDPDLPPLSPETELAIYRVAQESLTNVARHAEATRVEVSLERGMESVVLRVLDDGRGFDADAPPNGHGGLRGMRERAVLIGGALAIKEAHTGGVEVRLEVPAEVKLS